MNKEVYARIVQLYNSGCSVKECAKLCGISSVKAGRILITEGLWSTKRSEEIRLLLEQGKTKEMIAEELCISVKAVEAYIPYQRGAYMEGEPSKASDSSREYRTRISNAQNISIKTEQERNVTGMKMSSKADSAAILHISLRRNDEDSEIDRVLYAYGGVQNGDTLYRDIVIPDTMPLYALHYCILRAFGFLNEHLHKFWLPEEITLDVCNNKMKDWRSLCGILFADPWRSEEDQLWLDDYETGSFRNWQRSKYTGPYYICLPGDSYEECQVSIDELYEWSPYAALRRNPAGKNFFDRVPHLIRSQDLNQYKKDPAFDVIPLDECSLQDMKFVLEGDPYTLRESLRVTDVLGVKRSAVNIGELCADKLHGFSDVLLYEYDFGDGWEFEITRFDTVEQLKDKHKGKRIDEKKYTQAVKNCLAKQCPVCIRHEGNYLVEDAGGLYGYIQFLRSLHPEEEYHAFMDGTVFYEDNGPYTSRDSSLIWAESLDWQDKTVVDGALL